MNTVELGLKVIESYRIWAQWLVTLDFAAIGAVAFMFGFTHDKKFGGVSLNAKWILAIFSPFALSILAASMVVGNLSSVMERYVESQDAIGESLDCSHEDKAKREAVDGRAELSIGDIRNMDLNTHMREWGIRTPLWVISTVGGISFTLGAFVFAGATAIRFR